MTLAFSKYHGAGNDFILIDNRQQEYHFTKKEIALLCHRRFGIGADGMMVLENLNGYDFSMKYYNSDGAEGSMCGNGGRCIVAFAHHLGIIQSHANFMAVDGVHQAIINSTKEDFMDVSLQMTDVEEVKQNGNIFFLDTGSPHHIDFVENLSAMDIFAEGKKIRHSEMYESIGGTNVNFIEQTADGINIRTYERGVEDETLACGTGATAAAIAYAIHTNSFNKEIKVQALGGLLRLSFEHHLGKFTKIVLSGPTQRVFSGKWKSNNT
jgi:diaminopimelate epimerase